MLIMSFDDCVLSEVFTRSHWLCAVAVVCMCACLSRYSVQLFVIHKGRGLGRVSVNRNPKRTY